ncbi:Cro/C1-type HTH DNA-binding domain-containing protein [Pedobacter westerhofensis]|uniref:Cro/C1-type HTH DNA-binding domain-containing protein n=1 Tax=Pedobacter westerhofensis TaxID=425512 RepID=A0A521FRB0_9SPHI|nr:helix-turn-helix transcriptional regulator [Pedobacter westerhofensis]SMO98080.1 Cro/C1-type HTH DNA-binding domain-containing protein [Pedobacter westerhofensis]
MGRKQYIDTKNLRKLRDRIQKLIIDKNIPVEALADRTGFTSKQVYRIIYGKGNTSISNIFAIAGAMEIHIMELFVIDFQIPFYDIGIDLYRKNNKIIKDKIPKAKPITAAEAIRILTNEGYFKKTNQPKEERTLKSIVQDCQKRFRADFKTSEFSSALLYSIKKGSLNRYNQKNTGSFVYHS